MHPALQRNTYVNKNLISTDGKWGDRLNLRCGARGGNDKHIAGWWGSTEPGCKKACEGNAACQAVTIYYVADMYCSLWSTPCLSTGSFGVSIRLKGIAYPDLAHDFTLGPCTPLFRGLPMLTKNLTSTERKWGDRLNLQCGAPGGKEKSFKGWWGSDEAACKKACEDSYPVCQAFTIFFAADGFCELWSTPCVSTKGFGVSIRLKGIAYPDLALDPSLPGMPSPRNQPTNQTTN